MRTPKPKIVADNAHQQKDFETLIREINESLRQHPDEFVLLVEKSEKSSVCDTRPEPFDYILQTKLYLGIVSGDTLIEQNKFDYSIPTNGYTFCEPSVFEPPRIFQYDGSNLHPHSNILLRSLELPFEPKNPLNQLRQEMARKPTTELELFVGDKEVSAWANNNQGELLTLAAMAKPLGRTLPQAITSKVACIVAEKQKNAISRIAQLLDEYRALGGQIRQQCPSQDITVPSLSIFQEEEVLITVEEAAFFGSFGRVYQKLKDIENQIRRALDETHQLGLTTNKIIQLLCQRHKSLLSKVFSKI